jgi:hypothetical protein
MLVERMRGDVEGPARSVTLPSSLIVRDSS